MDSLMNNSLTGKVAEKGLDNQVGKDTCCPDLGFKVRVISFLGMFIFGKLIEPFPLWSSLIFKLIN